MFLPAFVVFLVALTLGFGLMLSGLNVYLRDVEHILAAIAMLWFFLTPIFYTLDQLPEGLQNRPNLLNLSTTGTRRHRSSRASRDTVFQGSWPTAGDWIYCAIVEPVMLPIGMRVFRRLERDMAIEL